MASIFMYHAVGDVRDIEGSDPHYAVGCKEFENQIVEIATSVPLAKQVADSGKIDQNCITFDDGHLSNYVNAFPILTAKKLQAEFYINTAFIGNDNYMNWEQLKEMNEAGMSIQSHGHHHQYFSDLSDQDIEAELSKSKQAIEEKLGTKVTVFAPPGGRFDERVIKIAKQLGYQCIATSIPGTVKSNSLYTIPRFAVIHSTDKNTIRSWCDPNSFATLKQSIRYSVFAFAKYILGNKNYEKLRAKLLGEGGQ